MSSLTRRAFLEAAIKLVFLLPLGVFAQRRLSNDEEFVIVNGWVLRTSDLR